MWSGFSAFRQLNALERSVQERPLEQGPAY
jgi:hypothetical protein